MVLPRFFYMASKHHIVTVGLVQRGYSDKDIAKIMGGNHLRVFQAVLDHEPRGHGGNFIGGVSGHGSF